VHMRGGGLRCFEMRGEGIELPIESPRALTASRLNGTKA